MEKTGQKETHAINDFIIEHMHIVHQEVYKIARTRNTIQDHDELVQLGMLGLIQAAHRFDGRHQHAFSVYARIRIQGSIIDAMRTQDWVPRSVRKREQLLQNTIRYLHQKKGCLPSRDEIAQYLNIPIKNYDHFLLFCLISPLVNVEDEISSQCTEQDIQEILIQKEAFLDVFTSIQTLNPQEKDIISLYYFEDWTLREIAEKYFVSESRICQVHNKIKQKLQKKLRKYIAK